MPLFLDIFKFNKTLLTFSFFVFVLFLCMALDWKNFIGLKNNHLYYISEAD